MARFQEGNPGGPGGRRAGAGRKTGQTPATAVRLFGGVSEAQLKTIIAKAVQQAADGDATSRAWLFDRVFGRVAPTDVLAEQQQVREDFDDFKEVVLDALAEDGEEIRKRVLLRMSRYTD